MSKRREGVNHRILEAAGWELVERKPSKRLWRHRETGEKRVEDAALELLLQWQRRKLRRAGWKAVSVQGDIYWRRPDTGYLCPRHVALYIEDQRQEKTA